MWKIIIIGTATWIHQGQIFSSHKVHIVTHPNYVSSSSYHLPRLCRFGCRTLLHLPFQIHISPQVVKSLNTLAQDLLHKITQSMNTLCEDEVFENLWTTFQAIHYWKHHEFLQHFNNQLEDSIMNKLISF